jgi:hypothetical protein
MFTRRRKVFALLFAVAVFALLTALQFANAANAESATDVLSNAVLSGSARVAFSVILSAMAFKVFEVWLGNIESLKLLEHKLQVLADLSEELRRDMRV